MKKLGLIALFLLSISTINAQAFNGEGDSKFQLGATFQEYGTGIRATYDRGLGENFSLGVTTGYVLGVNESIDADFGDRIDLIVRFNANIGSVINISDAVDIYPGLNLSLKQFGGHLGGRYFFSDGFGVYTEFSVPFARYDSSELSDADKLNSQFIFSLGAVFNL